MMIKEGVLENPDVDAIFGLHISSLLPMNKVYYKPRGFFASSSRFTIKVIGSQAHGGTPWLGVDPIIITAQIINSIQTIKEKTEKKLKKFQSQTQSERDLVVVSEIRKKNWYERYRWFMTTDGFLTIGGRDAASNSAVIRKHLDKNDRIFHGDIFGSPFFILKDAVNAPDTTMNEIAAATVCFSRAWREGLYGVCLLYTSPRPRD